MRKTMVLLVSLLVCTGVSFPAAAGSDWPEELMISESFDVAAGGQLRVEVSDADLDLRVGSGGIRIEVYLASKDLEAARTRFESMNFRAKVSGGEVSLRSDPVRGRWNWREQAYRVRARITLPEQFDVDITTGDGDVRIEKLNGVLQLDTSDGDVTIGRVGGPDAVVATSDGDIEATELDCDNVTIKTSDGDITVGRIDGAELELRTSDGDILIESVSGPLRARTGDGDIQVGFDRFAETSLTTGDGDVAIRGLEGLAAELDISASEIVMSTSGFSGRRSSRTVQGTLNGGGPMLRVSSRDGTVMLDAR